MLSVALPEQGQLVEVRRRRFVVTEVQRSALPPDPLSQTSEQAPHHLVRLSSIEDEGLGEELSVIWELEPGACAFDRSLLPRAPKTAPLLDPPQHLDAFLDAVAWSAVSSADVHALQAPFRSGIDIEDYQLDPVVRAIQMPRVNLLIADDVGLGKTIEAGLVVQELLLRHRARTVLCVCPSSLQIQWRDQLRDKFGLEFRIVDAELLRELRRSRGLHVNPWDHFPRLITSIDFLKRDRPMRLLREVLPPGGAPTYPRRFDLLIVDEAHNVAPSGRGRYATDSQRTLAVRALCPHFEHKLFLSATPHNGYPESFAALLELIDNQRFARCLRPDRDQLAAVMVRRLKNELPPRWDGAPRFPPRLLKDLPVVYPESERAAHRALQDYARLRQEGTAAESFATEFVLKLLKKRLFSSPEAFALTLEQHRRSVLDGAPSPSAPDASRRPAPGVLQRQIDGIDEDYASDEDYDRATDEAVVAATRSQRPATPAERALLDQLDGFAQSARQREDAKCAALLRWLEDTVRPGGVWGDRRVILFTEYRATQKWLQGRLAAAGLASGDRLLLLYGGMPTEQREQVKAAFQASPADAPVRILLCTDAASEGIDLQNHCAHLVHYEIPWNPNRLEQRNGRIDRHGQRAAAVEIFHFVGGTLHPGDTRAPGDLEGDLEFLFRAAQKVNTIREDLGKVGPVLTEQIEEAMLGRRRGLDIRAAEAAAEPARRLLKLERKLREQLAALHDQLARTRDELHLTPDNVESVVRIGLRLAGQPDLIEATLPGVFPAPGRTRSPVFHLPPLRGSWARCSEGLAHPHTGAQRPIVFDHALARGRDDVVLAHLNHRLVQLCLRLLRAETFASAADDGGKLRRLTARLCPDAALATPAIFCHGRLVVLGGDSRRLHEEIILAGGLLREGRFARLPKTEAESLLTRAKAHDATTVPDEAMQRRLLDLYPRFQDPLLKALEARREERAESLRRDLEARAKKEQADIESILTELRRSIEAQLAEPPPSQLDLFAPLERDQHQRDHDSLRARAAAIPDEITREQAAIAARYADPTARLFPLAVTFLLPASMARSA